MYHDPPANAFLGPLAKRLTECGTPAAIAGRGSTAYVYFVDVRLNDQFGQICYHNPLVGRSMFVWDSGHHIAPVTDIEAAARLVLKAVNPRVEETS